MKRIFAICILLALALACTGEAEPAFRVTGLQLEYMTTPIGTDVSEPRFSWKMESNGYGQRQSSYRIVVSETATGRVVWESQPHPSSVSAGIMYSGEQLKACTRYDWTVTVWNADADSSKASSWFETGLMDSGWSGAEWISSGQPHFSKYRSSYRIDFDLDCTGENPEPGFIFGRQDDENYVRLQLGSSSAALYHVTEGAESKDWEVPMAGIPSHIGIKVVAHDYAKGYKVWLIADNIPLNKEPVEIRPYPVEVWKPFCRFNTLGFEQRSSGCEAFNFFTASKSPRSFA